MTPDHWDPAPHERKYMRHKSTNDRGWCVRREGRDMVRYDRPAVDQVSPLGDWDPEPAALPKYSAVQIAQVCFEADKKLCWALGHVDLAKRDWADLAEKMRVKWITDGPLARSPAYAERMGLYKAIRAHLEQNAQP